MSIRYFIALITTGICLFTSTHLHAKVLTNQEIKGKQVLYVASEKGQKTGENDDKLVKEYLESLGLKVKVADSNAKSKDNQNVDLIIISSTADNRLLRDTFKNTTIPVLTWNAYSYADLGMTGKVLHQDFSVVRESVMHQENHANFYANFVNAAHPIAEAGELSPGLFGALFFSGETDMNWANPTLAADILATFKDRRENAAAFVYERGTTMHNDFIAPARRAGLYLGDDSFHQLTEAHAHTASDKKEYAWFSGKRLFNAAVRWALSEPQKEPEKNAEKLADSLKRAAKGKKLLYVRRLEMPWPAGEASINEHVDYLKSLGFKVTVRDTMESDQVANDYDLIVISAAINKFKFANKYSDAKVPVILEESKNVDGMNMVGRERTIAYGTNDHKDSDFPPEAYINVIRASHPLSGASYSGLVKLFKNPGVVGWAKPPAGATVIATMPNRPDHAAIWGYEKGATMAHDHIAPAKRVSFPMDFSMFAQLTEEGLDLYNAVLLWSITK